MPDYHPRPKLPAIAAGLLLTVAANLCAADPQAASASQVAVPPAAPQAPAPEATAPQPAPPATVPRGEEAAEVELPTFRFGLWEYRRTLLHGNTARPQGASVKKCVDPARKSAPRWVS